MIVILCVVCVREINPLELATNSQKSRLYFQQGRWSGKRKCPRCNYRYINHLSSCVRKEGGDIHVNGVGMFLVISHVPIWQG